MSRHEEATCGQRSQLGYQQTKHDACTQTKQTKRSIPSVRDDLAADTATHDYLSCLATTFPSSKAITPQVTELNAFIGVQHKFKFCRPRKEVVERLGHLVPCKPVWGNTIHCLKPTMNEHESRGNMWLRMRITNGLWLFHSVKLTTVPGVCCPESLVHISLLWGEIIACIISSNPVCHWRPNVIVYQSGYSKWDFSTIIGLGL